MKEDIEPKPEWRDSKQQFAPSNQYWKFRSKDGRSPDYTPETIWEKFKDYAQWMQENPLYESKAFGTGIIVELPKMRAMTIKGFCLFANIAHQTFLVYEKKPEYSEVIACIKDSIYTQKFEGASAEFLNPNIIARDLGLADNQNINLPQGTKIEVQDQETKDLLEEVKKKLNDIDEGNESI